MSFPTIQDYSFWAHKKAPAWGLKLQGLKPKIDLVVNSHVKGRQKDFEREWGNYVVILRLRMKQYNDVDALLESFFRGANHMSRAVRLLRRLRPNHPHLQDQMVVWRGKPRGMFYEEGKFSPSAKRAYQERGRQMQALALAKRIVNSGDK